MLRSIVMSRFSISQYRYDYIMYKIQWICTVYERTVFKWFSVGWYLSD